MDKKTVIFCAEKIAHLAKLAGSQAEEAESTINKLNLLMRQKILLEAEKVLLKSALGSDYCSSCGQRIGGPVRCCNEYGSGNPSWVSEVDAFAVRAKIKEQPNE